MEKDMFVRTFRYLFTTSDLEANKFFKYMRKVRGNSSVSLSMSLWPVLTLYSIKKALLGSLNKE